MNFEFIPIWYWSKLEPGRTGKPVWLTLYITRKIGKQVNAQPTLAHRPGSAQPIAKPKKKQNKIKREAVRRSKRSRQCEWTNTNHVFFYLTLVMDSTLLSNEFSIGRKRIQRVGRTNSEKCWNNTVQMLNRYIKLLN